MADGSSNRLGSALVAPVVVFAGMLALWENEGRFDYASAARDSAVAASPYRAPPGEAHSLTGDLVTDIPIPGEYVEQFTGYHVVSRRAEIYSWREIEEDGSISRWEKDWYGDLEDNPRNRSLRQTLSSKELQAPEYRLGLLRIEPERLRFVDAHTAIGIAGLRLADAGVRAGLQPGDGYLYKTGGRGRGEPQLGDERVSYTGVRNAPTATYFGFIDEGLATAKDFRVSRSFVSAFIKNDGILHHLVNGVREAALQTMQGHFDNLRWMVRLAGTAFVVVGFYMFISGFMSLFYGIPFIGALIETGAFVLSAALGVGVSLAVMLVSIVVHNPLVVALPLALIIAGVIFVRRRMKANRENVERALRMQQASAERQSAPGPQAAAPPEPPAALAEATFTALARLSLVDGVLDKKENRFLVAWGRRNGIAPARLKELFAAARQPGGEIRAASRNDVVLMACLAMADGAISAREMSVLTSLGSQIGLTARDMREIVVGVQSGSLAPA